MFKRIFNFFQSIFSRSPHNPSASPRSEDPPQPLQTPAAVEPEVEVKEEVRERPPADQIANGPPFNSFDLHPDILKGLEDVGFRHCTPVQQQTLPFSLAGKDVASQAQTGTGKTAAFLITVFQRLLEAEETKGPRRHALILAPTRELALQIHSDARLLGRRLNYKPAVIYGGVGYTEQIEALKAGAQIVIATPGRLIDLLKQKIFNPKNVRILVIDEADRMLDMGFISDLRYIMRRLPDYRERQSMLFSATLSSRVLEITYEYMNVPEEIRLSPQKLLVDEVDQVLYHVASEEKISLLLGLFKREQMERVLIFANTKVQVMKLTDRLNANGYKAKAITGDFAQNQRERILNDFKEGKTGILVATDVASRGLHVEDITHVINYDVPQDREEYVHRIGRTARAGKTGKAITFASERDAYNLEPIQELLTEEIPVEYVEDEMLVPDKAPSRRPSGDRYKKGKPPRARERQPKGKEASGGGGGKPKSKSRSSSGSRSRRKKKAPSGGEKK